MKSYRKELWFNAKKRREYINITPQVAEAVRESGVQEGMCLVNAMHITASVHINDNEGGLIQDFDEWLEGLAPLMVPPTPVANRFLTAPIPATRDP